jgi:hypothetical protein
MKKLVAIHTEERVAKVGLSGWGKDFDDKTASIEPGKFTWFGKNLDCLVVTAASGRQVFILAEHVIAVAYEEVEG